MRFHANLNCDKLWISYAGCNSISPLRTACERRNYFGKARTVYRSQEKAFAQKGPVTLKEKSPVPGARLLVVSAAAPAAVVGSIRPISDCTAPLGTAGSSLPARKRKAMNS